MPTIDLIKGEAEQTGQPAFKNRKTILIVENLTGDQIIINSFNKDQSAALANFIKEKLEEFYKS